MLYCSYPWRKKFAKEEALDPTAQLRPGMNQVMELSQEHGVVAPMARITGIVVPNLANALVHSFYANCVPEIPHRLQHPVRVRWRKEPGKRMAAVAAPDAADDPPAPILPALLPSDGPVHAPAPPPILRLPGLGIYRPSSTPMIAPRPLRLHPHVAPLLSAIAEDDQTVVEEYDPENPLLWS